MNQICIDKVFNRSKREDNALNMLIHVIDGKKCIWVASDYKTGLHLIRKVIDTLHIHDIFYEFNASGRTLTIGEGQLMVKSTNTDWEKLMGHEFDYYAFPA